MEDILGVQPPRPVKHTFAPRIADRRRLTRLQSKSVEPYDRHNNFPETIHNQIVNEFRDKERKRSLSCSPHQMQAKHRKVKDALAKTKEEWAAYIQKGLNATDGSLKGFVRRTKAHETPHFFLLS